jgi:single-strand DNA-binding protein
MNNVSLIGRLCKDPEIGTDNEGKVNRTKFTLAIDRSLGDGVDYIPVICFSHNATFSSKYFKKGMRIGLWGEIRTSTYTNKEGQKVYPIEVVARKLEFADGKSKTPGNTTTEQSADEFMQTTGEPDGVPFN